MRPMHNYTPSTIRRLVEEIGHALDRVKKAGYEPSDTTVTLADMGDLCCMIEVEAKRWADANPCGCNKQKGQPPAPPTATRMPPPPVQTAPPKRRTVREIFKRKPPALPSPPAEYETPTASRPEGTIEVTTPKRPGIDSVSELHWDAVLVRPKETPGKLW